MFYSANAFLFFENCCTYNRARHTLIFIKSNHLFHKLIYLVNNKLCHCDSYLHQRSRSIKRNLFFEPQWEGPPNPLNNRIVFFFFHFCFCEEVRKHMTHHPAELLCLFQSSEHRLARGGQFYRRVCTVDSSHVSACLSF